VSCGRGRGLVAPVVRGEENLPDPLAPKARPLLFVGNHTRFGLYDLPFLVCELYLRGLKARRRLPAVPLACAAALVTQRILMHALSGHASPSPAFCMHASLSPCRGSCFGAICLCACPEGVGGVAGAA